jgi:hypothetical protein
MMSNNTRKRRNYDDIDDMNEEERKGRTYLRYYSCHGLMSVISFPLLLTSWMIT